MSFSVKAKITILTSVFTTLLMGIVLFFLFGALRAVNYQTTEERLESTSKQVCSELVVDGDTVYAADSAFVEDNNFTAVYDAKKRFLCGYMPSAELDDVGFEPDKLQYHGSWVIYDDCFEIPRFGQVKVRTVTDMKDTDALLGKFKLMCLAAIIIVAVATSMGTYLILRRSLRPLKALNETASSISNGGNLSERIDAKGKHDEFGDLAMTFNGMLDRLERSFRQEQRFTNDAAHELRTPISVILSESEYAMRDGASELERQEGLEKIHAQAAHTSALINQLLTFARADRDGAQLELETIDLSSLMELVCETASDIAVDKGIEVECDIAEDVWVEGDETLLIRMVLNLVENAIRYGREGGEISVCLQASNDQALIVVKDDGMGIAPEDLPHIWDRFYRGDKTRMGTDKGVGLGLSMVKLIAEAHGGSVSCSSVQGQGSIFTVALPLRGA